MSLPAAINKARLSREYNQLIDSIPYARLIGIECFTMGDELFFKLPMNPDNQGNPMLPAIHGGVIGGFMELAASLHILFSINCNEIPKVVDFALDYVRAGLMKDTYAECIVVRQGRKIVNVTINAWQTHREEPIATARAHFLLPTQSSDS